jgi:hypothetical protein
MKKKILTISLLVILAAPFIFIGLTIINSKDCTQLVIDTSEIHSGIDIPKVSSINCYFDDERNVRLSIYSLKGLVFLDKYLYENKFEPVDLKELSLRIALSEQEKPREARLYAASGTTWGNEWRYIVEKETNRLWVEIKYN